MNANRHESSGIDLFRISINVKSIQKSAQRELALISGLSLRLRASARDQQ